MREDIHEELSTSPFYIDATFYPTFTSPESAEIMWSGARDVDGRPMPNEDGRVFIEINDASNDNNWAKVTRARQPSPTSINNF